MTLRNWENFSAAQLLLLQIFILKWKDIKSLTVASYHIWLDYRLMSTVGIEMGVGT